MRKHGKQPHKLRRKDYEAELRDLQAELCHLQDWVRHTGARIIVEFEERDAAGKGGTIRALTERVSPRVFRTVALPAPSDREKIELPRRSLKGAYDDTASLQGRRFVPDRHGSR